MTLPNKNGNRQSETRNAGTIPYVYSPPNWLYQIGSDTRTRTAYGNTASTSMATFTYDGYNRLATSQTAAETTTYTYNALGERIKKINQNSLATSFHYGPNGELLYEQDQAGNTKVYVWLDGRPLARIDNDAQIYYRSPGDAAGDDGCKLDRRVEGLLRSVRRCHAKSQHHREQPEVSGSVLRPRDGDALRLPATHQPAACCAPQKYRKPKE